MCTGNTDTIWELDLQIKYEMCCSGRRIWQGRDAIFGCPNRAGRLVAAKYSVLHPLQFISGPMTPPYSALQ